MPIDLFIVTPTSHRHEHIASIDITTTVGDFVILPGHAPMLLMIDEGRQVTLQMDNAEKTQETLVLPQGGIFEVNRYKATLIMHE